ncbi:hypothetical protein LCGC14_1783250 [marine sediment metagenome]|uniref:Uncharacterized protein n=1 Tax=marine sediment metagenome TaxID=412755 RepID=A0A0F9JUB9_9ZZZZ|nr:hypothetical protein [archaeon]
MVKYKNFNVAHYWHNVRWSGKQILKEEHTIIRNFSDNIVGIIIHLKLTNNLFSDKNKKI